MAKIISSLPGSTGVLSKTSQLINDGETGISTYVELNDLSTVATTGDYNNLINVPINFTPKVHTHNISDISGTKSEFNTSLIDGNFLFVGDVSNTPDATTTSKGVIKLAGDLAGTADAPTVPGLANKVDKVAGKSLIADAEIARLATLYNYTHPTNHPPSIITQDASNRFVTDVEKTAWNAKQGALGFTPENIANKSDSYTTSSSTAYVSGKALVDGLGTKANDNSVVHLTNNETISGIKTFTPDILVNGLTVGKGNNGVSENTVLGVNAGKSITTGNSNTFIGNLAGNKVTNNNGNTFVGSGAGQNSLGVSLNSFFGNGSGTANTTGIRNTAIGGAAGLNSTTGSNNVFLGSNSGKSLSNGSVATIINNSLMIGYDTRPLNNSETNQIVIGHSAVGLGSDTTVLGNSSTTVARVYGRQLVNTSTDNGIDQLQVNGTISASPATLPNQVVTKAQLDLKADLGNAFTAGRVPHTSSASAISDSSKLLWNNTNSYFEVNGNAPRLTLKNNINNYSTYFTNNANGILILKNHQDKTLAVFNNPVWSTDQPQMAIGKVSSIPVESQLYVYGGKNGANIDARGSVDRDEANIDLEGNDWETSPNSLGFSYFGSNSTAIGTMLGYPKNKLGIIRFQDTNYAIINSEKVGGISPIRFGINDIEIGNVNDKGFSYQSDFSSENISNPRWLADKGYVDTKAPLSGSANYIQNQTTAPQTANMWIDGSIKAGAATFSSTVTASNGTLIGGTLTSGYIPKATGANSLGNSAWQESATGGRLFDETDDGANKLQVNGSGFFNSNLNIKGSLTSVDTGEANKNTAFRIEGFSNPTSSAYETRISFSPWNYNGSSFAFREALSLNSDLTATFSSTVTATSFNGSATLTGTPTAPTAAPGTTGNQIATLDYVIANAGGGSGDMLLGTNQTVTSKKTFSNSGASTIGLDLNNSGTSSTYVLKVNNTASGWGQSIINSSNGVGINCLNSGTNIGIYTDNTNSGFGIYSMNQAGGVGIISTNNSTGTGIYISNLSSGKGLSINNSTTSTGIPFSISKNSINKLNISDSGIVDATQYKLKALNTAPISATATGTLGEIRYDANYMYVCVATNTWVRTALTTW